MNNLSSERQDRCSASPATPNKLIGDDIHLVCIVGHGRSGSTLLQRVLGTLDGYLAIGELTSIWTHYCQENQMCSCGHAFRDCEFWDAVFNEAFGGFDAVDADRMNGLKRYTLRHHKIAMHFPLFRSSGHASKVAEYADVHANLYRALMKISGCHTIIDSSKKSGHVMALSAAPDIQMQLVALVRDSRACAYSWQRHKRRTGVTDRVEYMEKFSYWQTSVRWGLGEVELFLMKNRLKLTGVYRYEDLADAPSSISAQIAEHIGVREPAFPFVSEKAIALGSDHSLRGNPSRFDHGVVSIRPDMEWRSNLAFRGKALITVLTLPWLMKYGYVAIRQEH